MENLTNMSHDFNELPEPSHVMAFWKQEITHRFYKDYYATETQGYKELRESLEEFIGYLLEKQANAYEEKIRNLSS